MKTTANYGFNKPEGTDVVNIEDFNSNADAIDIELTKRAMKNDVPIKTSQLNNDSGFITSGGAPVLSINGKVGNITLASGDIGAEPAITKNTAFNQNFETNVSSIKMDGTASAGTSSNVARADHVHPIDTTKVNQSDFDTHLADTTTYSTIKPSASLDSNGIYTEVDLKRHNGTMIMKSVLSGGTSPNYTTRTETYYAQDGVTVTNTAVYTRSYDINGVLLTEVMN